jgi:hypothetical protein
MKLMNRTGRVFILFVYTSILFFFAQKAFTQEITGETMSPYALNQFIASIYPNPEETSRRSLLKEEYPIVPGKCATPILKMALAHPDWLDAENRFILYRPDNPSFIRYYSPDGIVSWTYDTPEGHFKIHYSETGIHAVYGSDEDQYTIPEYVISFGHYFELVWEHEINTKGYNPPPPDENNGGDDRFDVYIKDMNFYGYTGMEYDPNIKYWHPYIVVHRSYDPASFESNLDPNGSRAGNMKITAAHEFFHAIQIFYTGEYETGFEDEFEWWEENTAVWMEDEVFDEVDGYLNYLGNPFDDLNGNLKWDIGEDWYYHDGTPAGTEGRDLNVWFEAPHISLYKNYESSFTRYQYGGMIWAKYLSSIFGEDFIKTTFIIANNDTDALTAVQQALTEYGTSLEDTFMDFRVRVLTLDPYIFEEDDKYPLIRHIGNYENYPLSLGYGDFPLGDMRPLSSCYIGLAPPYGQYKLIIDVDGQDHSHFGFAVVLFKNKGYEIRYIPIEDPNTQVGRTEIMSFGTEGLYKRATLIPMNLSKNQDQDYRYVQIYAYLEDVVTYPLRLKTGLNMISLPINLSGAATSFDFLQNYFDLSAQLQFSRYDLDQNLWQVSYINPNQPNPLNGMSFPLDFYKGYILSVSKDMTIFLCGDPPAQTAIDLFPGHNIISSLLSGTTGLSPKKVLESTNADSGKRISASIQKYDQDHGRRKCGYWFFDKYTGEDFVIKDGEGYLLDMVEGQEGWIPPQLNES